MALREHGMKNRGAISINRNGRKTTQGRDINLILYLETVMVFFLPLLLSTVLLCSV